MSGFSINRIVLSGNLTRDPELRTLQSGTSLCSLRLANNTRRKNGDQWEDKPNYFDVTIWGGLGEWVAKNMAKGATVIVDGRIEWREWEHEGQKRQAYDVIADSIVPAGGGNGGQRQEETIGGVDYGASGAPAQAQATPAAEQPPAGTGAPPVSGTPGPGSLPDTPENLQAHCICRPGLINDKCPIDKHGIPF